MTTDEIKAILDAHAKWLRGEGGERAELRGAYLRAVYLRGADLRGADLRDADLRGADLGADLRGADLQGADLRGADPWGARIDNDTLRHLAQALGMVVKEAGDG